MLLFTGFALGSFCSGLVSDRCADIRMSRHIYTYLQYLLHTDGGARWPSGAAASPCSSSASSPPSSHGEYQISSLVTCVDIHCCQVPSVRVHLVGDGHHGHRLLHRRLRLDHGDSCRPLQSLCQHVHELLLATVSPDHRWPGLRSEELPLAPLRNLGHGLCGLCHAILAARVP